MCSMFTKYGSIFCYIEQKKYVAKYGTIFRKHGTHEIPHCHKKAGQVEPFLS